MAVRSAAAPPSAALLVAGLGLALLHAPPAGARASVACSSATAKKAVTAGLLKTATAPPPPATSSFGGDTYTTCTLGSTLDVASITPATEAGAKALEVEVGRSHPVRVVEGLGTYAFQAPGTTTSAVVANGKTTMKTEGTENTWIYALPRTFVEITSVTTRPTAAAEAREEITFGYALLR
jgi:hypothetical protein